MIKRISAKIIIFIASILLLAHAVIPHFHFKNEVYVFTSACSENENHKHNAPEHNQDSSNNPDICILKQVVFSRFDDFKSQIDSPTNDFKNYNTDGFHFAVLNSDYSHIHSLQFSGPPVPFNPVIYSYLVGGSFDSRGSPLV